MNASPIEGTQLAGISNVALASLQVALVQQAQFKQTLEEIAARIREDERSAANANKAHVAAQNSAPGGTRAVEKANDGAKTGTGGNSGNKAGVQQPGGGAIISAPSGSLNIKV